MAIGTGDGPPDLEAAIRLAERYPFLYATVGVHPHDAAKATDGDLRPSARPGAASEGAGDRRDRPGLPLRFLAARRAARACSSGNWRSRPSRASPIVIHTREAWDDTMAQCLRDWPGGGIMHCFTGDAEQARQALELGFHLSFGGVLTFPKAEAVREAARITPDDRLLVETDCPYLAPVPHRGKRNEPAFVVETVRRLAEVRGSDAGGNRRRHHSEFRARCVCAVDRVTGKLVNLHEFRQAGAGPHRARDFRPDPGRPGAGGEEIAAESVASVDAVTAIGQYLQSAGGKRLRPALLLLSSPSWSAHGGSHAAIQLGAVVEMIHAATLVHDDVIDAAETRRGRPSTNVKWGNHTCVLAGDWLYMQAFQIALRERNFQILDLLIGLTQMMVEGELLQLERIGRIDVSEADCMELVDRKTACLFSRLRAPGRDLPATPIRPPQEKLGEYAWNLGMAFQLVDDVLDFTAREKTLGKPVGGDLREGKVTLPLVYALERATPDERAPGGDHPARPQLRHGALRPHSGAAREVSRHRAREGTRAALHRQGPPDHERVPRVALPARAAGRDRPDHRARSLSLRWFFPTS